MVPLTHENTSVHAKKFMKERNEEIYAARQNGTSVSELSKKYGLSDNRIRAICKRQDEKLVNEADLLYMAIRVLTSDVGFAGVVYGTLKRNGIHTIEEAKALTDEQMKKMRNCGSRMTELLKNFRTMAGGK